MRLAFLALASALLFGAGSTAGAATLTGTVTWSKPKPPETISIARDPHVCGAGGPIHTTEIEADEHGRIAGAVVFVDGLPAAKLLGPREVVFDQKNCTFVPHLAAATVGSLIRLKSSDPVMHNVHVTDAAGKTVANYAMPVMGQEASFRAAAPGELTLRCEAGHAWMRAALRVFDHPFFASTDARGVYSITNVPAGKHVVVAWHPDLGKVERSVEVAEDQKAELHLDFAF